MLKLNLKILIGLISALSLFAGFKSTEIMPVYCEETSNTDVIILLKDNAILEHNEAIKTGTDFIDTAQAENIEKLLMQKQEIVKNYIKDLYPSAEIKYDYTLLTNGFLCSIPENMINDIEKHPLVKKAYLSQSYSMPEMANAKESAFVNDFINETGCSGEGQVIAVLDVEFDVSHEMFSPIDNKKVKLKKSDMENILSTDGFNGSSSVEHTYVNSKVPYIFDYYDDDPYNPDDYHGTHVAGIAAGNRVTNNGESLSGIAPDSQLLLMSIPIYDGYIIAALEDAVRMHADVVNMSFGRGTELFNYDNPIYYAFAAAENAGVVICKSAGNDGRKNYSADAPDSSTTDARNLYPGILSVANVENIKTFNGYELIFPYLKINGTYSSFYENSITFEDNNYILLDFLNEGEYNCIYLNDTDFSDYDLNGKIVFVYEDDINFDDTYNGNINKKAAAAGATGLVIVYDGPPVPPFFNNIQDYIIPTISIKAENFPIKSGREFKTEIYIPDVKSSDFNVISKINESSSWGVTSSLEITPEIAAPGTEVTSAAYDNSYYSMSGTSMASPYVAGCVALLNEYLEKSGVNISGQEKVKYIKNILMNSAEPLKENEYFASPRQQGAGMVNMKNAFNDKVIMTGKNGEAKINAGDLLSENFKLNINISNISNENVTFKNAELIFTTDNINEDSSEVTGYRCLNCECDLSALKSVKAGEIKTLNLSVSLNPDEIKEISEDFINGFFVEGYILLSGAENCCDISVPVLGYYGDWCGKLLENNILYAETVADAISGIIENKNPEQFYSGPEERKVYISPVYYKFFDSTISRALKNKPCYTNHYLINETGDKYYIGEGYIWDFELSGFDDGNYTIRTEAYTNLERSIENPEVYEYPIVIDAKNPYAKFLTKTENGKNILNISADDTNLDGMIIIGKKKSDKDKMNVTDIINKATTYIENILPEYTNDNLSVLETLLKNSNNTDYSEDYNFIDVIRPENNSLNIQYDITDFEYYSVTVSDKVFNTISANSSEISKDNTKNLSINDVIHLQKEILTPYKSINTALFDINNDGCVNVMDLAKIKKILLNK